MNTGAHLHIRDATPDDRSVLQELTLAAFAQFVPVMPYWDAYQRDGEGTTGSVTLGRRLPLVKFLLTSLKIPWSSFLSVADAKIFEKLYQETVGMPSPCSV
jgi:hypothetical protein